MSKAFNAREIEVLRESVWHAIQRSDIPDEDVGVLSYLYRQLNGSSIEMFDSQEERLKYHLRLAERNAQYAYTMLFEPEAPKRSFWFRSAVGRAQSILMSCYVREANRK